ncbi:MAG: bifunctional diguanylate cyclase/phosphodiesterase [Lachnospiraceae bacterium]|nr:bifunctional diguanylate cyclase/phosphodiesterase [Lachnospiraceae bacterium]
MEELKYQVDLLNAMNEKLAREGKMLRLICETSNSAFLYYNYEEQQLRTIANWDHFFDFTVTDIHDLGRLYDCVEDKYVIPLKEVLFIDEQKLKSQAIEVKLKDRRLCIEVEVNVVYDTMDNPTDKVIRFKDVTKFNSQNDELTYMAYYDMLTGLYNRNYFVRLLGEYVRRAEEENETVAVMFMDFDDFRRINDGMGIISGDELVQLFGQFLSDLIGDNVIISHFNSDIFCIGIYSPCGARSVETIYRTIRERLKKPFKLSEGQEIFLTLSVGVAEYPEAATKTLELINCAEIVMFKAKSIGKDKILYYDGTILNDFLKKVKIENKLKDAVFEQNFTMYYQPQFHTTDKVLRGVEALIRWRDDNGKMISPAVFIPIAEKNGAIVPIGTWVIEESLRVFAGWKRKYHYPMIMSLNVSAIQYRQPDFIDKVLRLMEKYDIEPSEIELEITESILIDDFTDITEKLVTLRDIGIKISLDDFGTGYSSLSYLKGLPIDTLKIDKSFIDTVITDENTRIITESIIYMVKKLGFETIAEGVETEEQYRYLNEIDCDNIQGYFLGKPMPSDKIENLLADMTA